MNTTPPSGILSKTDEVPASPASNRDGSIEYWLYEQVGPAYDALKADPCRAVTVDRVKARLAAEHKRATPKQP